MELLARIVAGCVLVAGCAASALPSAQAQEQEQGQSQPPTAGPGVLRAGVGVTDGTGDRWVAATRLRPGDTAYVPAGGLTDAFGETNGSRIQIVPPPLEE